MSEQREIKFRAWDKATNSMVKDSWKLFLNGTVSIADTWATGDVHLMQYTGLKDQNGVEIYEGDIIQDPDHGPASNCIIKYEEGAFFAGAIDSIDGDDGLASEYAPSAVVIGNIHEHPELVVKTA